MLAGGLSSLPKILRLEVLEFFFLRDCRRKSFNQKSSSNPNPYWSRRSTAVHLQFVRQSAPHLYRCAFLASEPSRKGSPAVHLPSASHLYGSTFEKVLWVGVTGKFLIQGGDWNERRVYLQPSLPEPCSPINHTSSWLHQPKHDR